MTKAESRSGNLTPAEEKKIVNQITFASAAGNVLLTLFKLVAGIWGHSSAMVSDAIHSLSDVLTTLVAYLGVKFSSAPADKDHPYGHEQIENLATLGIGLALFGVGAVLCYQGATDTFEGWRAIAAEKAGGAPFEPTIPSKLALLAAVVSILVKEAMFWFTIINARKINSPAFVVDAWHHRSDAFSSIGSLIGVLGARLGFPLLDPIAAIVISLFILKVAYDILRESALCVVDVACDEELEAQIKERVEAYPTVDHVDLLRTRKFGSRVYVELEIAVDGNKTVYAAHWIAHEVHNIVEREFPAVKHVMVHVNPAQLDDKDGVFHHEGPRFTLDPARAKELAEKRAVAETQKNPVEN